MSRTVVQKAWPNARCVRLVHDTIAGDWYVREPDQELDDVTGFEDFEAAQAFFHERVKHWASVRNWEAQAAYDEAHGTDNGFAPWQHREY